MPIFNLENNEWPRTFASTYLSISTSICIIIHWFMKKSLLKLELRCPSCCYKRGLVKTTVHTYEVTKYNSLCDDTFLLFIHDHTKWWSNLKVDIQMNRNSNIYRNYLVKKNFSLLPQCTALYKIQHSTLSITLTPAFNDRLYLLPFIRIL